MNKNCVVLIPIYKEELDADEFFSVKSSLNHLNNFDVVFIGPENINLEYYSYNFPKISFLGFTSHFFSGVNGYNKLLTSESFYKVFENYDYMLILQTDAILLKNELSEWIAKGYDYIGAPWPKGYSLNIFSNKLPVEGGVLCTTFIGNGGLSLRKIRSCIELLREFPDIALNWQSTGHAEDLFFGFLSTVSEFFRTPNVRVAAKFAHDIEPQFLSQLINNDIPFGVHAWSKYNRKFWTSNKNWPKL